MPSCPANYDCSWTMTVANAPDQGNWTPLIVGLVAITFIITVGLLMAFYFDTHKNVEFKIK